MGLSQSLYTGYSGLATHQKCMDNLSNNLANVNTVGYKSGEFMFNNIFKKTLTGAMSGDGNRSTTNPVGVGLGGTTGAIINNFQRGPSETTGDPLHCYINDDKSFFVTQTTSGLALTRDGKFYTDHTLNANERMLCVGNGLPVQGWMAQNGTISPSQSVGNIYLPAIGDIMPGQQTSSVDLKGILPTDTSISDFDGRATTSLEIKGNLPSASNTLTTHIFAPISQTDGVTSSMQNEMREITVEIAFSGPTLSEDGSTTDWTWTMTTVDWPSVGDPGLQIYPPEGDPNFSTGTFGFHTQGSTTQNYGAGEASTDTVGPGASKVRSQKQDANGNTVTTFFNMPADFTLDVSRLTSVANPPGGGGLETWYVNGNPKGTMGRTITVFDEYTDFEAVDGVMTPIRKIEARENTIYFERTARDNVSSTWSWRSSMDDAAGELVFDTTGALTSSSQSGGGITYNFNDMQSINETGSLQATSQDGYRDGSLRDIRIDQHGRIWGHYTNNVSEPLAQLAMGTVPNTAGLEGGSGTLFYPGSASGALLIGVAGDATNDFGVPRIGAGHLTSGALESSNVDLSREFTNMIQTERGYQFNSRIVSTSDELLQTALQMKR